MNNDFLYQFLINLFDNSFNSTLFSQFIFVIITLKIDISGWFKPKTKKYQPWSDEEVKKL